MQIELNFPGPAMVIVTGPLVHGELKMIVARLN